MPGNACAPAARTLALLHAPRHHGRAWHAHSQLQHAGRRQKSSSTQHWKCQCRTTCTKPRSMKRCFITKPGLEKPEQCCGGQSPRDWESWLARAAPGTVGYHIILTVSGPRNQQSEVGLPTATNKPCCQATTATTISTPSTQPPNAYKSAGAGGGEPKHSPLSPKLFNPRGDPDNITKKLLLPRAMQHQLEPCSDRWLRPGGPFLTAYLPLHLPSAKAELQQQRHLRGECAKLWGATEQSKVAAEAARRGAVGATEYMAQPRDSGKQ